MFIVTSKTACACSNVVSRLKTMTIRKTNKTTGEVTAEQVTLLGFLTSAAGWRIVIVILILSMHPIGRGFLAGFGFKFPDEKLITVAAEESKVAKSEISSIADSIKDIKSDISSLKANNAILNAKVDGMEQTFRGFQIDFNKWKPATDKSTQ